mmetsp:Transcript_88674/g.185337  ORF Transcript_88674/g.185337 Transcript_88674/m.185337 type:complete len:549 (-) Transcript_88674:24-1670(-)|eukprot:CAMPEP_0206435010 /NCGR_PEP_ID=MMETSP0324_2-20121206/9564_1 /ASSEMBLY_ACC=CAM_ASM_000836 /TAXON_ID=2866 /ORGANISM="Crypthecodinium cohnii, Strain Seligo" /LENGTH=548 /DNA_ID=CAMNT_0053901765 /DNA_START=223 /DNA_END=1869 /DNA_ORIENTATION=-
MAMTASGPAIASGVLVSVDIKPDRVEDFLKAIEIDCLGSRNPKLDPFCARFDVMRSRESPNRFFFYEAYETLEGQMKIHRESEHFKAWGDFKATGGVEHQEVIAWEANSVEEGKWMFQANNAPTSLAHSAVFVTLDVNPDRVDEFLDGMKIDVLGSRDKALDPGCLRFDLLRNKENKNRFYFYEAYLDDAAMDFHKTTEHFKGFSKFHESGGFADVSLIRMEGPSIPGGWGFQSATAKVAGGEFPLLGFGTYKVGVVPASAAGADASTPPPDDAVKVCEQVVTDALKSGYRLLDCAQFYANEHWIGECWKKSGVSRDKIVFESKVWNDTIYKGADAVKAQVQKCIDDLQCEYLDIMLVHWPVPGKHVEAYKALQECKAEGKIKMVGISNYTIEDYEELKAAGLVSGDDKPVLNQFEVNPLLYRKKTIDYFKKEGIVVQSYRGLLAGPSSWDHPAIQEVCSETGRSAPEILGRFLVQLEIGHIPKASATSRMVQNSEIFGFSLSAAQMEKLSNLTTPEALENYKTTYIKCIWRDTPEAGAALPREVTIE